MRLKGQMQQEPSEPKREPKLTHRQRQFVDAYLGAARGNATEAARLAGYAATKRATLAEIGSQNLRKLEIGEAIKSRVSELAMTAEEVLHRLSEQARLDLGEFIDFKRGFGLPILKLDEAQQNGRTHLIRSVTPTQFGIKVEFHDPQTALIQIGKYHGLWLDKTALTGPDGTDAYADPGNTALAARVGRIADLLERARGRRDRPVHEGGPDLEASPGAAGGGVPE